MNCTAIASVNASDSFEHWHQVTCLNYSTTDCRVADDARFDGKIDVKSLGALLISDILACTPPDNPIRVTRRAQHIRKDARDDFMLWLTLEGTATLAQDDRAALMRPGDLVLHDQTRPFVLEFSDTHRLHHDHHSPPAADFAAPDCAPLRRAADRGGDADRRTRGIGDRASQQDGRAGRA